MPRRIVDVMLDGEVVEAYELVFDSLNTPVTGQDYIGLAKDNMKDGYDSDEVARATFAIRDP